MLRLKATKTSLYGLVSEYEKLPPMRRTVFTKAPRSRIIGWSGGTAPD